MLIPPRVKDLTGQKFGRLTVVSFAYIKNNKSFWNCVCKCGNEKIINSGSLTRGLTKSCGCLRIGAIQNRDSTRIDLTGQKFGRLTVVSFSHAKQRSFWNCVCECGTAKTVLGKSLKSGGSRSCGCLQKESSAKNVQFGLGYAHSNLKQRSLQLEKGEFLGVAKRGNGFMACIRVGNKRIAKTFNTALEAAEAYDKAAFERDGENAVLNFPEDYDL
jgi:hypothetical protein